MPATGAAREVAGGASGRGGRRGRGRRRGPGRRPARRAAARGPVPASRRGAAGCRGRGRRGRRRARGAPAVAATVVAAAMAAAVVAGGLRGLGGAAGAGCACGRAWAGACVAWRLSLPRRPLPPRLPRSWPRWLPRSSPPPVVAGRWTTVGVLLAATLRSLPLAVLLVWLSLLRVQRWPRRPWRSPSSRLLEDEEAPLVEVEVDWRLVCAGVADAVAVGPGSTRPRRPRSSPERRGRRWWARRPCPGARRRRCATSPRTTGRDACRPSGARSPSRPSRGRSPCGRHGRGRGRSRVPWWSPETKIAGARRPVLSGEAWETEAIWAARAVGRVCSASKRLVSPDQPLNGST